MNFFYDIANALFPTLVDRQNKNNVVIYFLNLKGTFLFCVNKEEKCQEKVWKRVKGFGEAGKNLS